MRRAGIRITDGGMYLVSTVKTAKRNVQWLTSNALLMLSSEVVKIGKFLEVEELCKLSLLTKCDTRLTKHVINVQGMFAALCIEMLSPCVCD